MSYEQYAPIAQQAAIDNGIDPGVFLRLIQQESNFDPNAQSPAGAIGIAQFMPDTAAQYGIDPSNPEQALYASAAHISDLLQQFGSYPLALAAYNAGPGAVQEYGGIPPFAETHQYLSNILGGGMPDGQEGQDEQDWSWIWSSPFPSLPGAVDALGDIGGGLRDWWNSGDEGAEESPYAPSGPTLTDNDIGPMLEQRGYTHVGGWGPTAQWRGPDSEGNTVTFLQGQLANGLFGDQSPYVTKKATAPNSFSLGPGQTRFIEDPSSPTGYRSISVPKASPATDPLAAIKLQQAQIELQLKQQNLGFLRDKFNFEMQQGMRREARDTQAQMFNQQMEVTRLNFDIQRINAEQERAFRTDMANLATQIGTLAQDPGDRAKYAAVSTANSGWGKTNYGQDYRTTESLMPLEQLLRIRQNAMGGPKPITAGNMPMPFDPSTLLGGQPPAGAPNPYAAINAIAAQQNATGTNTARFNTGANATPGGFPLDAYPQLAQPGTPNIMAPLQGTVIPPYVPEGTTEVPDTAPNRMEHGGMAEGAYISGEAGPELNIPTGKGKAIVLNEQQMDALGINLSRVMKMAAGGIFDGLGDDNRDLSRSFLDEVLRRGKANLGITGQIPDPTYASSPGFDPETVRMYASLAALESGYSPYQYQRFAALHRPQGVSERVTRRTA